MIPILYDISETEFVSNGLGRLRDCLSCAVTEERNGIYECEFTYPVAGQNFDEIIPGRIVAVTHDYTGTVEPFDIVSYSKPIDGIVTFRAVHISYRLNKATAIGVGITTLPETFVMFSNSTPSTPFTFETDIDSTAYLASADGIPKTVRSIMGGVEGSVLDAFGGEWEFTRFRAILHQSRGQVRSFSIRYGVNLVDYSEDLDYAESFTSVIPYWTDGVTTKVGREQLSGITNYNGRSECVPLDVSEKFEDEPTVAQIEAAGASYLASAKPYLPSQNFAVNFVQLQNSVEYASYTKLFECGLCDSVRVIFPRYKVDEYYKIVKIVYNVLLDRYDEVELGNLSSTLAEALGITSGDDLSNTKGAITEIQDWIENPLVEKASGVTRYEAKRTDTGTDTWFGVGSGGNNFGIYDNKNTKWTIRDNGSDVQVQKPFSTSSGDDITSGGDVVSQTGRSLNAAPQSTSKTLLANSSVSFTVPNNFRGVLITIGAGAALKSLHLINSTASGAIAISTVFVGSGIAVTGSTNTVTVANSTANQGIAWFMVPTATLLPT